MGERAMQEIMFLSVQSLFYFLYTECALVHLLTATVHHILYIRLSVLDEKCKALLCDAVVHFYE